MRHTMHHLPLDLMLEIFCRLPVKSVGRLRSLSKLYNSLLTQPCFIRKHLLSTATHETSFHLLVIEEDTPFPFPCDSIITHPLSSLSTLFKDRITLFKTRFFELFVYYLHYVKIWGSCDGLVCLENVPKRCDDDDSRSHLILWNPATKISYYLSESTPGEYKEEYEHHNSFGYDPVNEDYKIVRLVLSDTLIKDTYIYSCKNSCWHQIQSFPFNFKDKYISSEFVGGKMYWVVSDVDGISGICALDLTTERFEAVVQPDVSFGGFKEDGNIKYIEGIGLAVLDGKLCAYYNLSDGKFSLLMMNKDEGGDELWSTLCTIRKMDVLKDDVVLRPFYMSNGGRLLYFDPEVISRCGRRWYGRIGSHLFIYDTKNHHVESVSIGHSKLRHLYVQSLVSPINHVVDSSYIY